MEILILIVIVVSAIWVAVDAKNNKIPIDKKPYSANNGALAWLLTTLLFWIVGFPYYLIKRSQVMNQRQDDSKNVGSQNHPKLSANVEELERLAVLKEKGILNDAEFQAEKARLLGGSVFPLPLLNTISESSQEICKIPYKAAVPAIGLQDCSDNKVRLSPIHLVGITVGILIVGLWMISDDGPLPLFKQQKPLKQAFAQDQRQADRSKENPNYKAIDPAQPSKTYDMPSFIAGITHIKSATLTSGKSLTAKRTLYIYCKSENDAQLMIISLKSGLSMDGWTVVGGIYKKSDEVFSHLFKQLFYKKNSMDLPFLSFMDARGQECRLVCLNESRDDKIAVLKDSLTDVNRIPSVRNVEEHY
ncbi:MAG: SHOCT domain-containing protein [Planctomycetes bacterium]|nr:SHOCT domain-containing protein [Planctomycetota bacterium]